MRRSVWLAFAVLCLLSSADWLIPAATSDGLPPLERHGLLYGAVGLLGASFSARQQRNTRRELHWLQLVFGGVSFFGVPIVFFEWSGGSLSGTSRSVGFAAVPMVVVMVVASAWGQDGARRLMAPALAGLGGALLLLPFDLPVAFRGILMLGGLVVIVILVAIVSVWLNSVLQGFALSDAIAVVCLSNAVFLLICGLSGGGFVWRWSVLGSLASIPSLVEVIVMIAMVWLLREMMPVRFAARYLVIPLLTVLEGYVFLRPDLTVRMGFGMALLAVGAGMILFSKNLGDEAGLSLR